MAGIPELSLNSLLQTNYERKSELGIIRAKHTLSDIVHDFAQGYSSVLKDNEFFKEGHTLHHVYSNPPFILTDFREIRDYKPTSDAIAKKLFREQIDLISASIGDIKNTVCRRLFDQYNPSRYINFNQAGLDQIIQILTQGTNTELNVFLDAQFGNPCMLLGERFKARFGRRAKYIINLAYEVDPGSKWNAEETIYEKKILDDPINFTSDYTGLYSCLLRKERSKIYRKWEGFSDEPVEKKEVSITNTLSSIAALNASPQRELRILEKTAGDRFQTASLKYFHPELNGIKILITNDWLELYDAWWHKVPNVLFTSKYGLQLFQFSQQQIEPLKPEQTEQIRAIFYFIFNNIEIFRGIFNIVISDIVQFRDSFIIPIEIGSDIKKTMEFLVSYLNKISLQILISKFNSEYSKYLDIINAIITVNPIETEEQRYSRVSQSIEDNITFFRIFSTDFVSSLATEKIKENIINYFGLINYRNLIYNEKNLSRDLNEIGEYRQNQKIFIYGIVNLLNKLLDYNFACQCTCAIFYFISKSYRTDRHLISTLKEIFGSTLVDEIGTIEILAGGGTFSDFMNALLNEIFIKPALIQTGGNNFFTELHNIKTKAPIILELYEDYDKVLKRDYTDPKLLESILSSKYYEELYKQEQQKLINKVFNNILENKADLKTLERQLLILRTLFTCNKKEDQLLDIFFNIYDDTIPLRDNYFVNALYTTKIDDILRKAKLELEYYRKQLTFQQLNGVKNKNKDYQTSISVRAFGGYKKTRKHKKLDKYRKNRRQTNKQRKTSKQRS